MECILYMCMRWFATLNMRAVNIKWNEINDISMHIHITQPMNSECLWKLRATAESTHSKCSQYTAQTQEPRVRLVESDTLKKEWKKSAKHRNPNDDARTRILLVIWTNLVVEMRVLQSQNANVAVVVVVVAFFVNSHYSFVSMQMIITQLNR